MTLKDEFGNTIVTETNVTIKINNKTFTKTTIKDGVLNIELDVENLKANNYTIDVIYGENQIYLRGENSIQLNIVNRSVTIDLDTNATHTNGQIPIHATITDDVDGKLVDNGTVTLKLMVLHSLMRMVMLLDLKLKMVLLMLHTTYHLL